MTGVYFFQDTVFLAVRPPPPGVCFPVLLQIPAPSVRWKRLNTTFVQGVFRETWRLITPFVKRRTFGGPVGFTEFSDYLWTSDLFKDTAQHNVLKEIIST